MANVLVEDSSLRAIADAIRDKSSSLERYTPIQMAAAIMSIPVGRCAGLLEPHAFDLSGGYVNSGVWKVGSDTVCYSDVYEITANRPYLFMLDSSVGTRFRAMYSSEDISHAVQDVTGIQIVNVNNPAAYLFKTYTPEASGYITITKDNAGRSGLKTYLFDLIGLVNGIL